VSVSFHNQDVAFRLNDKTGLRTWMQQVAKKEKKKLGTISYVFCSDAYLLDINIRHLDHDTYTDIITFDYSESDTIHGDIMISIERVKENAGTYGVRPEEELRRVMIHGILHLCGYKDKTKAQAALMREKENAALKLYK